MDEVGAGGRRGKAGIEGIHRRTSSGGSSRSKEGRLRADWCDGENEEEARAVVVGGMGILMKILEWRRPNGDGTRLLISRVGPRVYIAGD